MARHWTKSAAARVYFAPFVQVDCGAPACPATHTASCLPSPPLARVMGQRWSPSSTAVRPGLS
ncbi:MAG: hypothetical protein B7Z23_14440, partial [Pseudomonadales bacterium 32-61-5]